MSTISEPLKVYKINAIDHWDGWHPVASMEHRAVFTLAFNAAIAEGIGYRVLRAGEGGNPWWAPFPGPDSGDPLYLIAWKQENNGTTFIVSPVELPHLGEPELSIAV